jgi:acyl-CoA thioesterase-1
MTCLRHLFLGGIALSLAICPLMAERIVFLGDSLTAGFGLDVEQAYPALVGVELEGQGKAVEIVNAGISGDTSAGGLRRLNWILKRPVDTLIIALGANDALRGQPVATTRENLRGMILGAREKYPEIRILLAGMLAPPNMGTDYTDAFARIYPELAEELEVELIPFLLEGVAGQPELNLADGIHPNARGQKKIAQLILRALEEETVP